MLLQQMVGGDPTRVDEYDDHHVNPMATARPDCTTTAARRQRAIPRMAHKASRAVTLGRSADLTDSQPTASA